jgi:hypothetical protein
MLFTEVLTTFAEFFERENIRWAIAGGLAVGAWGYKRYTDDIDFVVSGSERERVVAFAESLGYETTHASEVIYLYDRTETELFAAATKRVVLPALTALVISPEHIAMMKAAAIRDRPARSYGDARDVEYLLTLPTIDRERVRAYFERMGLLTIFNAIDHQRKR